jgi:hypothetical protein
MIIPQRQNVLPKLRHGGDCFVDNFLSGDWASDWKLLAGNSGDIDHSATSLDITASGDIDHSATSLDITATANMGLAACWHIYNLQVVTQGRIVDASSTIYTATRVRSDLSDFILSGIATLGGNEILYIFKIINGALINLAATTGDTAVNGDRWVIETSLYDDGISVTATNQRSQNLLTASSSITDSDILDHTANNYCGLVILNTGNSHYEYYRHKRI